MGIILCPVKKGSFCRGIVREAPPVNDKRICRQCQPRLWGDGCKNQVYALKIGEKFAVIRPNPDEPGKKFVTLFTKTGQKVFFKHMPVPRGSTVVAFFPEGNPPLMVKCEEILDKEPEGMALLDLPALGSGSIRTWLGTR